jgi:hypothetical protein
MGGGIALASPFSPFIFCLLGGGLPGCRLGIGWHGGCVSVIGICVVNVVIPISSNFWNLNKNVPIMELGHFYPSSFLYVFR